MLRSKWIRIPVKIILIWLLITIYFYFQHPVVYRYQNLNANIPIGNAQLLIHEIRASNLDEDKKMSWNYEKVPWQYKFAEKAYEMGIPLSWQIPVLQAASFYSRPPLVEDYWTLHIYGTFIYPEDIDADENTRQRFAIYAYPGIINGTGSQIDTLHNAAMINAHGSIYAEHLNEPLILRVVDNENAKSVQLIFTPEWQKERHWQRGAQYKSPADPVSSFLNQVYANKPQQALEYVLPKLRKDFPLPQPGASLQGKNIEIEGRLTWVDVFEDYLNVYRVDAEIGEFSENNFTPQENLTFYTVRDQDGNYKIVYWKSQD